MTIDPSAIFRTKLETSEAPRVAEAERRRIDEEIAPMFVQLLEPPSPVELDMFAAELEAILDAHDASPPLH